MTNISEKDRIRHYKNQGICSNVGTLLFLCPKGCSSEMKSRFKGIGEVPRQAKMRMWYHIQLLAKMSKTRRLRPLSGAFIRKMKIVVL